MAEAQSELLKERKAVPRAPSIADLAPLDESVTVKGNYFTNGGRTTWSTCLFWRELFATIAPTLLIATADGKVSIHLAELLLARSGKTGRTPSVEESVFDTIKIQFLAHDLITVKALNSTGVGVALFWGLTQYGHSVMLEVRSVRLANLDSGNLPGV